MRFDLAQGFPLLTTKRLHIKSIIHELLWFLRGDTNVRYLQEHGVRIWDEWADAAGELGPVYGRQWRSWPTADGETVDQIGQVVAQIKRNPDSRRLIVSAWNVGEIERMALPPCHALFQFYVADGAAVLPALPTIGRCFPGRAVQYRVLRAVDDDDGAGVRSPAGEFIHTFGDAHLYLNHIAQAQLQLSRDAAAAAPDAHQSGGQFDLRLSLRGFRACRL